MRTGCAQRRILKMSDEGCLATRAARKSTAMIEAIRFGRITIEGRTYHQDVLIHPDRRVTDGWWRRQGHRLVLGDLVDLLASQPEIIVAGTGIYGRMRPDPNLFRTLEDRNIELVALPTEEAVVHFNRIFENRRTAGGFHLTC